MIEKMKEITVVCLASAKEDALTALRELGVMHVKPSDKPVQSEELADIRQKKDKLQEIINYLIPHKPEEEAKFPEYDNKETIEILKEAWQAIHDIKWYEENVANHDRMYDALKPWGNFDGSLITQLREKGLDVRLCACKEADMPELPEDVTCQIINTVDGENYFIVISTNPIETTLPEVQHLHLETSLSELEERNEISKKTIATLRGKLQIYANYLDRYEETMNTLLEKEEFLINRDGMGNAEQLAYISGYIAVDDLESVKSSANKNGMAMTAKDVDPENPEVPTKLRIPKFAQMTMPFFKFIGIMPGYNETDASIPILFFLSLFFAMIIGDAGYGVLFSICAIIAKMKLPKQNQLAINLILTFSITTVGWGLLTGTFFGIPQEKLPSFLKGINWFTGENGEANIKQLCFIIAAIHLTIARVWKAVLLMRFPFKALGHLGWAVFIWGNYFLACTLLLGNEFPEMAKNMYIAGAVLILLFNINWKDSGNIINAPFDFINSFVDVLSYIRLFAVGFASLKIAQTFNGMGMGLFTEGGLSVIGGIIVIGLGHLLNIILGFMAVLVHGIRLNTLEFSNHVDITWGGIFFKPFKKINKQ